MDFGSGITYIAQTKFKGKVVPFGIKDRDRLTHVFALGAHGSTAPFLARMALQDIERGLGTVILDATGSLAELVCERLDDEALKRLIFLDPYDSENPFSWNAIDTFRALPREEGTALLSEAIASVYRIEDTPLTHLTAEILLDDVNATVLLLYTLLVDEAARAALAPDIRARFEAAFAADKESAESINDNGRYLAKDHLMRNLLGQKESKVPLASIPEGAILVVDVSKIRVFPTRITPLVRLFLHAVRAESKRRSRPVSIFLNECTRYLSFDDIESLCGEPTLFFSSASSVRSEEEKKSRDHVLLRTGSVVAFSGAAEDVPLLERIFYPYIAPDEIEVFSEGEAAVLLTIDGVRAKPFIGYALPVPPHGGISIHDLLIRSRARYTTPRAVIEQSLRKEVKEERTDKDQGDDTGSFSNAFRSIFAKSAGGPPAGGSPPPSQGPSQPFAERKAFTAVVPLKQREIPEEELRSMLYVEPITV